MAAKSLMQISYTIRLTSIGLELHKIVAVYCKRNIILHEHVNMFCSDVPIFVRREWYGF